MIFTFFSSLLNYEGKLKTFMALSLVRRHCCGIENCQRALSSMGAGEMARERYDS